MNSLRSRHPFTSLIIALSFLLISGCSHSRPVLVSIAVTPANPSIAVGAMQQFTATGTYSDNTMKDITATATWASATPAVATISATGLATAVAAGNTAITASLNGKTSAPDTLTVTGATLISIQITPVNPTLTTGISRQLTATGTFSDASVQDITATVTWASATTAAATITAGPAGGLATPVAAGTSVITATKGAVVGKTTLTVAAVNLVSIQITPVNPTIGLGQTVQFTATGTYSDGSKNDITTQSTWNSGTTATATIVTGPGATGGLATPVAAGSSAITASLNGVTSAADTLTVTSATLVSIAVTPANPTAAVGGVVSFTATGTYTAGPPLDLTGVVTWSSLTPAKASIDPATGLAKALAVGSSTIQATSGTIHGQTLLTVNAAHARFAYTGNQNSAANAISIYAINAANGTFSNRGYVADSAGPSQVIPDLSGQFAYALEADGTIKIFTVNPANGSLTPSALPPVPNGSPATAAFQGFVDPTGRYLYLANLSSTSVSAFAIDFATGNLTAFAGSPYPSGASPVAVISDPAGKFLYSVNSGDNTVSGYTVNADGTLTPVATFTQPTGNAPGFPAIDPVGHLYIPNGGDNTISGFTINADGTLTALAGSPFSDTNLTLSAPGATAIDLSGKFLFVSNVGTGTTPGTVSVFPINLDGSLAASSSSHAVGISPNSVSVDPTGSVVAVTNFGSNNDSLFSFDSTTGTLTPTLTTETGQLPQFTGLYISPNAPTVAPAAVYATNSVTNNISAYTVNPANGVLSAATPPTVGGVAANGLAAADLAGTSFYTAGPTAPGHLAGFSVNQATAALAPLTSSPAALGGAVSSTVLADPSERFVYVAGKGVAGSILAYDISAGSLTPITGSPFTDPSLANLNALAMDPQGEYIFGLRTGFIVPVFIDDQTGKPVLPPTTPATTAVGNWTSGVVDASGQFLLALDSTAKTIQAFSITTPNGTVGTDALLVVAGAPVPVGGTLPSNIAIDPLDRFVFVTDATANTITVFSFDVTTGAVVQVGLPVGVPSGAGQAAVDVTGTYLYVALAGTPGSVAAYSIGATGTLTAVAGSPFPAGNGTLGVAISNSIQ